MQEINLYELAEIMGDQIEGWQYYYDKTAERVIEIQEQHMVVARELLEGEDVEVEDLTDRKRREIEKAVDIYQQPKAYVMLPTKWQVNMLDQMKAFVDYMDDEGIKIALAESLESRQPEWSFRDEAIELGVHDHWHGYYMDYLIDVGERWCDQNELSCTK